MTKSERRLVKVARMLIAQGWTQHVLAEDADGKSCDPCDPDACRWCLEGALQRAAKRLGGTFRTVYLELQDSLFHLPTNIPDWNDLPGRTHAEVLDLLDTILGEP